MKLIPNQSNRRTIIQWFSIPYSIHQSIFLTICPSIHLSFRFSVCSSVCLSVHLSVHPSNHLFINLSVCPSVHLCLCKSLSFFPNRLVSPKKYKHQYFTIKYSSFSSAFINSGIKIILIFGVNILEKKSIKFAAFIFKFYFHFFLLPMHSTLPMQLFPFPLKGLCCKTSVS